MLIMYLMVYMPTIKELNKESVNGLGMDELNGDWAVLRTNQDKPKSKGLSIIENIRCFGIHII